MRESINNPCFPTSKRIFVLYSFPQREVELQQATSHWDERKSGREEITLSAFLCERVDVTASSRLTPCAPFVSGCSYKTAHFVTILHECL